jgi:transposase
LIGDKAYDPDAYSSPSPTARSPPSLLHTIGVRLCPPRDLAVYCERNFIERFFHNLRQFRAIATRYDSLARHFLGVSPTAASIMAR